MKILNYQDYDLCIAITNEFINNLNESSEVILINIKPIIDTLSLNNNLYVVFNDLVNQIAPIVKTLSENTNIGNDDNINTLLTLNAVMIFYLDERKLNRVNIINGYKSDDELRSDIRSVLEELKLAGNGNGIVKKITECISIISSIIELVCDDNLFTPINKNQVIKILNSICKIINIHTMTIDQFVKNFTIVNQGLRNNIGTESLDDALNKIGIHSDAKLSTDSVVDITNSEERVGEFITEKSK
jgi:hypothetical protein